MARFTWLETTVVRASSDTGPATGSAAGGASERTLGGERRRVRRGLCACGDERRRQINSWCSTIDARVVYIQQPPPAPTAVGCHMWMPSGCPRQPKFDSTRYEAGWVLDVGKDWVGVHFSESNFKAKGMCRERRMKLNAYCGVVDVKSMYIGSVAKLPEAPGCYLMMPSGCPRQPTFDASNWKGLWGVDQWHGWVENEVKQRTDGDKKAICEDARRQAINSWCGTKDARSVMVFRAGLASTTPISAPTGAGASFTPS